jgi:hypothetical protein
MSSNASLRIFGGGIRLAIIKAEKSDGQPFAHVNRASLTQALEHSNIRISKSQKHENEMHKIEVKPVSIDTHSNFAIISTFF